MRDALWNPPSKWLSQCQMAQFMRYAEKQFHITLQDYEQLYQWSLSAPEQFWLAVAKFCTIRFIKEPERIRELGQRMQDTRWFLGARLNFAENLLMRQDEHLAFIFFSERGNYRTLSYAQLFQEVGKLAAFLREKGVVAGNRVVGMMPNIPESAIAMLATTALGAIWSACSPDFGLEGLVERFGQIEPKILFAVDGHSYKGKIFNHLDKINQLQKHLPSLKQTIIVPYIHEKPDKKNLENTCLYTEYLNQHYDFRFESFPFDQPVYILHSSGTTGKPKCLVHGAGRTLLQHLKELQLHTNLTSDDRFFFYTTCSWMMWNWLISGLAIGATLVLYDGAPFFPESTQLFDLIDKTKITVFGVGAKFLESCEKLGLSPKKTHNLSSLRTLLTTGSPLLKESFYYVYEKIKKSVQLSSISGGSDIISCFALGNPLKPVYPGELQSIGLGMSVKVFNSQGDSVIDEKGELVCTQPFPSMPLYFWNDPDGKKYHHAYFEKYLGVWSHGDYAEITSQGGVIIYGRSDATLNPGGIRIGTAEIYRPLVYIPEIIDSLAVGQKWGNDERIILFVVLQENKKLTEGLRQKIKNIIREKASPHHVPEKVIQVPDLPRTKSGKLVELLVKDILEKKPIDNLGALENPEVLKYFSHIKELERH